MTIISVSVCVGVSPSLSSLLQVSAANYLGRRIGSSLDVAPFKRHASAQDQRERKDAALGVCAPLRGRRCVGVPPVCCKVDH